MGGEASSIPVLVYLGSRPRFIFLLHSSISVLGLSVLTPHQRAGSS